MQVAILSSSISSFVSEFAAVEKLAKRNKLPIPTYTVGDKYLQKANLVMDGRRYSYMTELVNVTVSGLEDIRINGWSMVATVEYAVEGMIQHDLNIEIPTKYGADYLYCDHCGGYRHNRSKSYVVHNRDTGEYKQIGGSCLGLYDGGVFKRILKLQAKLLEVISISSAESFFDMGSTEESRLARIEEYVIENQLFSRIGAILTAKDMIAEGATYVKRKRETNNTCTIAQMRDEMTDKDFPTSSEYVDGLLAYWDTVEGGYEHEYYGGCGVESYATFDQLVKDNIATKYIRYCDLWSIYFAVVKYEKHLAKLNQTNKSTFVGVVGEKAEIKATITGYKSGEGYYGFWEMWSLVDDNGNLYTKFGKIDSKYLISQNVEGKTSIGDTVHCTAQIKEHSDKYDECKTVLGRLSALPKKRKA